MTASEPPSSTDPARPRLRRLMSAFSENFPLSESIGIFVGVSGVDWLAEGYAEPLKALGIALLAGVVISAYRLRRSRRSAPGEDSGS